MELLQFEKEKENDALSYINNDDNYDNTDLFFEEIDEKDYDL